MIGSSWGEIPSLTLKLSIGTSLTGFMAVIGNVSVCSGSWFG